MCHPHHLPVVRRPAGSPLSSCLVHVRMRSRLMLIVAAVAALLAGATLARTHRNKPIPPSRARYARLARRLEEHDQKKEDGVEEGQGTEVGVHMNRHDGDTPVVGGDRTAKVQGNDVGNRREGEEGSLALGLPRCFALSGADPAEGAWRASPGGVEDSPASHQDWNLPKDNIFNHLKACQSAWDIKHRGQNDTPSLPHWVWEANKCGLDEVTSSKFCHIMEGRKGLLLVGDSLTRLLTTTLAAVLQAKLVQVDADFEGNGDGIDEWSACGGKLTVRYVRNDYLEMQALPFPNNECYNMDGGHAQCHTFATDETLSQFDTLVVNSGAHPRSDAEYAAKMTAAATVLSTSMKRIHGEGAILVVRNTVPGHWNCIPRRFEGPVDAKLALSLVEEAPEEYKWNTFHGQNKLLEAAFSRKIGWWLLDAYSPTILRADSHIGVGNDCLHYCVPGPADHWVTLLHNLLVAATTATTAFPPGGDGA